MSDAEAIASMTPEQLAKALGGELITITRSACDACEKHSTSATDKRYIINFRVGDETQAGAYCLGCLHTLCFHALREQAHLDSLGRSATAFGREGGVKDYQQLWYETHTSLIFIHKGQVPQTKGAFTDCKFVVQMIADLKKEYGDETRIIVVGCRCGEITADDADEWLHMREVTLEAFEEQEAHIRAGVCADCGACSLKEAEDKCRPRAIGDTGDYGCDGDYLWQDEREEEGNS